MTRTITCDECRGSGRAYRDYYDRGSPCPECDGLGEWEDDCDESWAIELSTDPKTGNARIGA